MVGTPNKGSSFHGGIKKGLDSTVIDQLQKIMGLHFQSVFDITNEKVETINDYLEDENNQKYYTVNGDFPFRKLPLSL